MNIADQEKVKNSIKNSLEEAHEITGMLNNQSQGFFGPKQATSEQIQAMKVVDKAHGYIDNHLGDITAEMRLSIIENHLQKHPNDSYARTIREAIKQYDNL